MSRPILRLKKRPPIDLAVVEPAPVVPMIVTHGDRRAAVAPVRRKNRYVCVVMGKDRPGPTKIYTTLTRARREAGRLVVEAGVDHVFVLRIVESAKLEVPT